MVEGINHPCNIICKDRIFLTKILNINFSKKKKKKK